MGYYSTSYLSKLVPELVAAELHFAVCPTENLQLQGWGMIPTPRGVAPIRRLTESGLNVAFGQDSIADPSTRWVKETCCGSSTSACMSVTC